jgi:predicted  nucleic acid-binding Zn-ribbon protein
MTLKLLMNSCLSFALDGSIVSTLAEKGIGKAAEILRAHFTLSSDELGQALQKSYGYAASAIGIGLAPAAKRINLWKTLVRKGQKAVQAKISKEFASQVINEYLDPFSKSKRWPKETTKQFCAYAVNACLVLSKQTDTIISARAFPEADLAGLLSNRASPEVTAFLIEQTRQIGSLSPHLFEFLAFNQLLGHAVLFFFREQLRKDERVERTFAELQREGLWADIHHIKNAQDQLAQVIQKKFSEQCSELRKQKAQLLAATTAAHNEDTRTLMRQFKQLKMEAAATQKRIARIPQLMADVRKSWETSDAGLHQFCRRFESWGALLQTELTELQKGISFLRADMVRTKKSAEKAARAACAARQAAEVTVKRVDSGVSLIREDARGISQGVIHLSEKMDQFIQLAQAVSADVFISHAFDDHEHAINIARRLAKAGVKVWMDPFETASGLSGARIEQAVKGCKVQVIICSNAAIRADRIKQQTLLAWKYQRPYIPLVVDEIHFKEQLNYWLDGRSLIEMMHRKPDEWLRDLLQALEQAHIRCPISDLDHLGHTITPIPVKPDLSGLRAVAKFTDRIWPLPAEKARWKGPKQRDLGAPQTHIQHGHAIGSRVAVALESDSAGFLTFLDEGPSGNIYCLCPSAFAPDAALPAGRSYLPQPGSSYDAFVVTGNPGREHLLAIITKQPLDLAWMPRSPNIPARLLNAEDIELLLSQLKRLDSASWTAYSSYFDVMA